MCQCKSSQILDFQSINLPFWTAPSLKFGSWGGRQEGERIRLSTHVSESGFVGGLVNRGGASHVQLRLLQILFLHRAGEETVPLSHIQSFILPRLI